MNHIIWERRKQHKLGRLTGTKEKMGGKWKARTCCHHVTCDAVQRQYGSGCSAGGGQSPATSDERNSNGGPGTFLLSPLLPSSSSSPPSGHPINTCRPSSHPGPNPHPGPALGEPNPHQRTRGDAGRPGFLGFQVKSREPTASALSSHGGSCLRISFFLGLYLDAVFQLRCACR